MATRIYTGAGASPDRTGKVLTMTEIERKAFSLFAPHVDTKRAVWIEGIRDTLYKYGGPADDPAKFRLVDRIGNRELVPSGVASHPIAVTDTITGKPALMFGAGGAAPNALDASATGSLFAATQNAAGDTDNDAPIFLPATGYSLAAKLRVPPASGAANGVTFGATVGGAVIGSRCATLNDNFMPLLINPASGFLFVRTRYSVVSWEGAVDYRDNLWHDYVIVYDSVAATVSVWVDGVLIATAGTPTVADIQATAGCDRLALGAIGTAAAPQLRYIGLMSHVSFLPGPVLADAAKRSAVRAMLATR